MRAFMWCKRSSRRSFCQRAIAYVKSTLEDRDASATPAVDLGFEQSPACQPLCDGLGIFYLVDLGDKFEYVQYGHMQQAGLTLEQLHKMAVDNLAAICKTRLEIRTHSNIFAFLMGGDFEASCMLVSDLFDRVLAPY